jgi:hypothetical protein
MDTKKFNKNPENLNRIGEEKKSSRKYNVTDRRNRFMPLLLTAGYLILQNYLSI